MYKGSLTVMAATSFLLILSVLFVLLEGTRMKYLDDILKFQARMGMESLMGEYCIPLWNDYKILALDTDTSGEKIKQEFFVNKIFQWDETRKSDESGYFFHAKLDKIDFSDVETLANADGTSFERKLSLFAKINTPFSMYGKWKKMQEQLSGLKNAKPDIEAKIDAGSQMVSEEIMTSEAGQTGKTAAAPSINAKGVEKLPQKLKNMKLLGEIQKIRKNGILNIVISGNEEFSDKSIELSDSMVYRTRIAVPRKNVCRCGAEDAFLTTEHLLTYLKFYDAQGQTLDRDSVLSYEVEYVVGGKASDIENLKVVCYELLAMREAANMTYLATDPEKQKECLSVATALAGAGTLPQLIEPIKVSIMAAWAFGESILDLRSILSGEKVPIMKNRETWTSSIGGLVSEIAGGQKAKKQSEGLLYKDYLRFLVLAKSTRIRAFRAMDIMEKNIRLLPDYEDYRIDAAVIALTGNFTYQYKNVFFGFVTIGKPKNLRNQRNISVQYSYQEAHGT